MRGSRVGSSFLFVNFSQIRAERLFFHPVDEDLSPGTPDLTEKPRSLYLPEEAEQEARSCLSAICLS